jgi:hypothetical protein
MFANSHGRGLTLSRLFVVAKMMSQPKTYGKRAAQGL